MITSAARFERPQDVDARLVERALHTVGGRLHRGAQLVEELTVGQVCTAGHDLAKNQGTKSLAQAQEGGMIALIAGALGEVELVEQILQPLHPPGSRSLGGGRQSLGKRLQCLQQSSSGFTHRG